jgi:hypothetical protein
MVMTDPRVLAEQLNVAIAMYAVARKIPMDEAKESIIEAWVNTYQPGFRDQGIKPKKRCCKEKVV